MVRSHTISSSKSGSERPEDAFASRRHKSGDRVEIPGLGKPHNAQFGRPEGFFLGMGSSTRVYLWPKQPTTEFSPRLTVIGYTPVDADRQGSSMTLICRA